MSLRPQLGGKCADTVKELLSQEKVASAGYGALQTYRV